MKIPRPQTNEEKLAVLNVEKHIQDDWGFAKTFGLKDLVDRWDKFVGEVEDGYGFRLHEYTYELSLRDELEDAMASLPERFAEELRELIAPLDHRFRFATDPARQPLAPPVDRPDRYWWSRIPKKLVGELLDDLMAEHII